MFNVILVCHKGSAAVPRFFTLDVSGMPICVHVTADNAFFSLQPAVHSVSIRGVPIFSIEQPDLPADPEPVSKETYMARLAEFLALRIPVERAQAATQMDLLRFYFMENNMAAAKMLLKAMPATGDTVMLRLIAENPRDFATIESRYFISSSGLANKNNTRQTQRSESRAEPPAEKTCIGSKKELDVIVKICSEFDESTATIFLLEILDTIAVEMLPRLMEDLSITNPYNRIYLRLKTAERMLHSGMARMAVFFLISTSVEIASAQDILLKNELVRIALEHVADGQWAAEIETVLAQVRADEVRKYGAVLTANIRCQIPGKIPEITVTGHTRLFDFQLFKSRMEWCFTGKLCIFNKGRAMIDGLIVNSGSFVPVFRDCAELVVDCSNTFEDASEGNEPSCESKGKIHVKTVLLSTGQEIPVDREFSLVEKECDISLVDVEHVDGQTVYIFDVLGDLNAINVQERYGTLSLEGRTARLFLKEHTRIFTVDVEVAGGVFEEKVFYVDENEE